MFIFEIQEEFLGLKQVHAFGVLGKVGLFVMF